MIQNRPVRHLTDYGLANEKQNTHKIFNNVVSMYKSSNDTHVYTKNIRFTVVTIII